jgi:hypothetical protein
MAQWISGLDHYFIGVKFGNQTMLTLVDVRTTATCLSHVGENFDDHFGDHAGSHRVLIRAGKNAWRYYSLNSAQLRFWRKLTRAERNSLERAQDRQCFICALRRMTERREKLSARLYASLMTSLLIADVRD